MLELPEAHQNRRARQHVLELIQGANREEITRQITRALLLGGQLGFTDWDKRCDSGLM
jgi:hypothetical protein